MGKNNHCLKRETRSTQLGSLLLPLIFVVYTPILVCGISRDHILLLLPQ